MDGFFSHPLLVAVLTLIVGTIGFGLLKLHSERTDVRRQNALALLDEVSGLLNALLSNLKSAAQKQTSGTPEVGRAMSALYLNRLPVRTKSRAYLRDDTFWRSYDSILEELHDVASKLRQADEAALSNIAEHAIQRRCEFPGEHAQRRSSTASAHHWSQADLPDHRKLSSPWLEIHDWLEVIWLETDEWLAGSIKEALSVWPGVRR